MRCPSCGLEMVRMDIDATTWNCSRCYMIIEQHKGGEKKIYGTVKLTYNRYKKIEKERGLCG